MSQYTVIFQGRLGSDPERKSTQSGQEYIELQVAFSLNKGTDHARTLWTICSCWGDTVSRKMIDSLKKGSFLQVNGMVSNLSSYINKKNEPASTIYVKVLSLSYLDSPKPKVENNSAAEKEQEFEEVPF